MYEWLQTEGGKAVITESGYVPYNSSNQVIPPISATEVRMYPNPVTDGFYITGLTHPALLTIVDLSGRRVLSRRVANGEYIRIASLPSGIYIATVATEKGTIQSKISKK
ncbi:MAG: T9SS type A sorting domain-containing protein [Tannerella sp.]|jgi:hypothetical protein|nr:T9SS type A sorting domain-containing protein [Tannerella sp.]